MKVYLLLLSSILLVSCASSTSGDLPTSITIDYTVTPSADTFGNVLLGTESSEIEYKFENKGNVPLGGCTAATLEEGNYDEFVITKDDCGTAALKMRESCSVFVKAVPTSVGVKAAGVVRRCIGGSKGIPMYSALTALAIYPDLAWTPTTHAFGNVLNGTTTAGFDFVFSNTGSAPATGCTAPVLSDTTNYTITADSCGVSDLAVAADCTVTITANPTSTGAHPATLTRDCTVGDAGHVATLTQTGVEPVVDWTVASHDFGNVLVTTDSATYDFVFSNTGSAPATGCAAPALSGANSAEFSITADGCGVADLANGATCTVTVKATPATAVAKSASLDRACGVGGSHSATVTATGIEPVLNWNVATYDFGNINNGVPSAPVVFTLTNSGTDTATGCAAPIITGGDTAEFVITDDQCGVANLGTGASCTVTIVATPSAVQAFASTLRRVCAVGGTKDVPLALTGI